MAKTEIISNRERPLGSLLSDSLQRAVDFRVATAFINSGGLAAVLPGIKRILEHEGSVYMVHGADFRIADPMAVRTLAQLRTDFGSFHYYVHVKWDLATNQQFHPKLYVIDSKVNSLAVVGSSNLTKSGLSLNDEVNAVIQGEKTDRPLKRCRQVFGEITRSSELIEPTLSFADDYGSLFEKFKARHFGSDEPVEFQGFIDKYSINERDVTGAGWEPRSQMEIVTRALQMLEDSDLQIRFGDANAHQRTWSLDEIYRVAHIVAKQTKKSYKWESFHHSVRRSINQNVVDVSKGTSLGHQLFRRNPRRTGEYRLTDAGRNYAGQ